MKILQLTAPGKFVIEDQPVPEPGPGQVLLRVNAVTTCPQWDLHLWHSEPMFAGQSLNFPYQAGQPGHEAAGVVETVGPDVSGFKPGDRVATWRAMFMK